MNPLYDHNIINDLFLTSTVNIPLTYGSIDLWQGTLNKRH